VPSLCATIWIVFTPVGLQEIPHDAAESVEDGAAIVLEFGDELNRPEVIIQQAAQFEFCRDPFFLR